MGSGVRRVRRVSRVRRGGVGLIIVMFMVMMLGIIRVLLQVFRPVMMRHHDDSLDYLCSGSCGLCLEG